MTDAPDPDRDSDYLYMFYMPYMVERAAVPSVFSLISPDTDSDTDTDTDPDSRLNPEPFYVPYM